MTSPDCILSAHTPLGREAAEAAVLQWLEESGLEVEYGSGDRWIAWTDDDPAAPESALTVEVQVYALPGEGSQVRWHFRPAGPDDTGTQLRQLAQELHGRLQGDPLWVIDLWNDGRPNGGAAAGA